MKEGGFSLIEVLAAFAILALALVAIFRSYGLSAKSEAQASQERLALDVARELIATGADAPEEDRQTGTEGALRWQREISPWRRGEAQGFTLYHVAVTVEWGQGELALSTLAIGHDASP
jgi:general secretion pathway protein I